MNYKEFLEQQERDRFKEPTELSVWLERLTFAQSARSAFDTDYDYVMKMLSNVVDTSGKDALDKYTDKSYTTNWLLKLCLWMESYIMQPDIYIDLKSYAGVDDMYSDRLVLEQELNHLFSEFRIPQRFLPMIRDRVRYGFGASYSGWNGRAIDAYWRKGKPNFFPIDCRKVWIDESACEENFRDRRWTFMLVEYDVDDAKRRFPEYAEKIAETPANTWYGDNQDKRDKFDVYVCQYHVKQTVRMVDIAITEMVEGVRRREIKQYLAEEVADWLANGEVPDNVEILDMADPEEMGYDAEVENVFEFMFSEQLQVILEEPRHVMRCCREQGLIDQFCFWTYHTIDGDVYPRGMGYILKGEQAIKTIIMTKAIINAIKDGRSIPFVREGAIKNMRDFVENHNSLDFVAVISDEWSREHAGEKPFDTIEQRYDPSITIALNNLLTQDMQAISGGTDSMMGQAQYAGMSAAQTGLLQASGATYTKQDELTFKEFVRDVAENYLVLLGENKTYEHYLEGTNETGGSETLMINEGDAVEWDYERYYCCPTAEYSSEQAKLLKKEEVKMLQGMGVMSPVRMLEELGYSNASQIVAEAEQYKFGMNITELLMTAQQTNPEMYQQIVGALQSLEQPQKASNA